MINEYKNELNEQSVKLVNRSKLEITGIKRIISLNENEFIIDSNMGIIYIEGSKLEMKQLEMEKGSIQINGNINSIRYNKEEKLKEKKQSILGKVFK